VSTQLCSNFAGLKRGDTKQFLTSCLPTADADETAKAIKQNVAKIEDEFMVFKHFAW